MSEPRPHPITLERIWFTKSLVEAIPEYVPHDGFVPPPHNELDVRKDASREGGYVALMRTVINPDKEKSGPYSIEMICMAALTVEGSLDEAEANRGVTITAHSVLYGAVREAIAWTTGRQPYGQLSLGLSVLRGKPKDEEPTR
jgi:hypothetical protein